MKDIILGTVLAIVIFLGLQTIVPFPYGLILGIMFVGLIIWYVKKHSSSDKDSILNYRRVDPINDKEKAQNDETLRIIEKKYIEEKISKEEYLKRKKEFEDIEYNPLKCKVCGSKEFEFISEKRVEELGEHTSDVGYYRCKRCGAK